MKLATDGPSRRGSVPGMVYALVGIPLIGAVLDGVRSVRGTGKLTGAGMAVPLLLILLGIALGAGVFVTRRERRRRIRSQTPMPAGQWEAVVQEAGWHFHAKPEDAPAAGVLAFEHGSAESASVALTNEKDLPAAREKAVAVTEAMPVEKAAVTTETSALGVELVPAAAGSAWETEPPTEAAAATVPADPPPRRETPLQPWKELTGSRTGERVIVLLHRGGFHAVPIRCMTPEQASHLHRMVIRKLRPSAGRLPR